MRDFKLLWIFLVSLVPIITLIIRGVPWGADSFAFLAVACGQAQYVSALSSPGWFTSLLPFFGCNIFLFGLVQWFFYFFALLGLWFVGKLFFGEFGWKLPVFVGTLTPLFFVQVLSFENDFFSWTLSFIVLGLFSIGLMSENKLKKGLCLFLAIPITIISINLWLPSIFILLSVIFLLNLNKKIALSLFFGLILIIISLNIGYITTSLFYLIQSFNPTTEVVAEEIPIVGLIFIIHIIHFWKRIPNQIKIYSICLIGLGLLKSKYMFLATPFLLMGLIDKDNKEGLTIRNKTFPVLFFVIILGFGWIVTGIQLAPNHSDLIEMKEAINLAEDMNFPLFNSWGYGWQFRYLGYNTIYAVSPPEPDWNNLSRPYIAYSNKKLDCEQINKKTFICSTET